MEFIYFFPLHLLKTRRWEYAVKLLPCSGSVHPVLVSAIGDISSLHVVPALRPLGEGHLSLWDPLLCPQDGASRYCLWGVCVCVWLCIYVYLCVCLFVCICVYACTHTCIPEGNLKGHLFLRRLPSFCLGRTCRWPRTPSLCSGVWPVNPRDLPISISVLQLQASTTMPCFDVVC